MTLAIKGVLWAWLYRKALSAVYSFALLSFVSIGELYLVIKHWCLNRDFLSPVTKHSILFCQTREAIDDGNFICKMINKVWSGFRDLAIDQRVHWIYTQVCQPYWVPLSSSSGAALMSLPVSPACSFTEFVILSIAMTFYDVLQALPESSQCHIITVSISPQIVKKCLVGRYSVKAWRPRGMI